MFYKFQRFQISKLKDFSRNLRDFKLVADPSVKTFIEASKVVDKPSKVKIDVRFVYTCTNFGLKLLQLSINLFAYSPGMHIM